MRTREEIETTITSILRQIKELASDYQNSEPFRARMVALADSQMHTFHEYGEVHDYKIVCNSMNNTPEMEEVNDFKFLLKVQYKDNLSYYKGYGIGYTQDYLDRIIL